MSDTCIHELGPGQCAYCIEIPFGIEKTVYRTQFGKAFHNWENCEYLESGQKFAESQGRNSSAILPISWSLANQTLTPCEWCCALYYSRNSRLEDCLIEDENSSRPGKIVKDRYLGRKLREYIIYFPESGDIEVISSRYVKRFK